MDTSKIQSIIEKHLPKESRETLLKIYRQHTVEARFDPMLDYLKNLERHIEETHRSFFKKESESIGPFAGKIKSEHLTEVHFTETLASMQNLRICDPQERKSPREMNDFFEFLLANSENKYQVSFRLNVFTVFDSVKSQRIVSDDDTIVLKNFNNEISIELSNHQKGKSLWVSCLMIRNNGKQNFFTVQNQFREFFNLLMRYDPNAHGLESLVMTHPEKENSDQICNAANGKWRFAKTDCGETKLKRYWSMQGGIFPDKSESYRAYFLNPDVIGKFEKFGSEFCDLLKSINLRKSFYTPKEKAAILRAA